MKQLTIDELLALQLLGCEPEVIMKADKKAIALFNTPKGQETLDRATAILDRQESLGITTLAFDEPDFPAALKAIGRDCPPLIHLLGNTSLLECEDAVAIIGARKATRIGCDAAYRLGLKYGKMGSVVVSGLALGCDAAAHKGALDAGSETIAIVATGLDITHPHENVALQQRILESGRGLLLSEQPLGIKANPTRLVARNRLQAALSQKVIVAECSEHSGTMHTVRFALRYGKLVSATSFKIWNDTNSSNHYIINNIGTEETL